MDAMYKEECRQALDALLGELKVDCPCGGLLNVSSAEEGGQSGRVSCEDCGKTYYFNGHGLLTRKGGHGINPYHRVLVGLPLLKETAPKVNGGRGHQTARYIIAYLEKGMEREAGTIWETDGDKLALYPEIRRIVQDMLGCRVHRKHNCQNWLCK